MDMSFKMLKESFFDRDIVLKKLSDASRKVLSKFGAFVWKRDKSSMRYRNKPSQPGQPPSVHRTMRRKKTNKRTGVTKVQSVSPLRDFTFFAYDSNTESVVEGPAKLNGKVASRIPNVLELGGRTQVYAGPNKTKTVTVAARPHTVPAMKAELPKFPALYANSVRA